MNPPSLVVARPRVSFLAACLLALVAALGCARGNEATPDATVPDGAVDPDASKAPDGSDPDGASPDGADPDGASPDGPQSGRCATNDDCSASPAGAFCDTSTGLCAQCLPSQDMCPPGQVCDPSNNACRAGCSNDADCGGGAGSVTHCDVATRRCVGCAADADCALGTVCQTGACVPGCNESHGCGVGRSCCANQCVDLQADGTNCGACAAACGAGGACCMGACQTVTNDPRNCGRCGNACSAARASPACAAGACAVGTCDTGFGDCDRDAANGCESDFGADPMNCGACGSACRGGANATARCASGRCMTECAGGFGDCDGNPANGCEVAVGGDPRNCGTCGRACPSGASSSATCAASVCGVSCAPGTGDCDADASNGCETSLTTSATSCGACGVACAFANGNASCAAGRCALSTCRAGFDNCDGDAANGCETATGADSANCGRCGSRCPAGTACSGGSCSTVCAAGTTFCGDRCVRLDGDPANCGACGRACPGGANADAVCASGGCGLACNAGFGDCDGSPGTGCETSTRTSVANCGACGVACRLTSASVACTDGTCRLAACVPGFANCNGSDGDGCETNVSSDVSNCGGCARRCALPNAGASCSGGACSISGCAPGFANCDGADADGCEVNASNDNFNCGRCGFMCPPGTACSGGACSSICGAGTTFCAGACINLQSDARNCGGCGNVCPGGQSCAGGVCRLPAPANDTCGGAQALSLAATDQAISTTTVGANSELAVVCGSAGPDVWFRFTLAQRELVYADTAGTAYDTVLHFATGCGAPLSGSPVAGTFLCNDDMGSAGCTGGGLQSQVVGVFGAGTYYLVLGGYGGASGPATLRFQHLPLSSGAVTPITAAGTTTLSGATSGASAVAAPCGFGSAAEATHWWKSCPDGAGGAFSATTCSRASYDTVLYLRNADAAGNGCNDDGCGGALQSTVAGSVGRGAGLHALYVNGYNGASGSYSVQVTRP